MAFLPPSSSFHMHEMDLTHTPQPSWLPDLINEQGSVRYKRGDWPCPRSDTSAARPNAILTGSKHGPRFYQQPWFFPAGKRPCPKLPRHVHAAAKAKGLALQSKQERSQTPRRSQTIYSFDYQRFASRAKVAHQKPERFDRGKESSQRDHN